MLPVKLAAEQQGSGIEANVACTCTCQVVKIGDDALVQFQSAHTFFLQANAESATMRVQSATVKSFRAWP